MANRIAQVVFITFVAVAVTGCSASPPTRFYTLDPTATTGGEAALSVAVAVGPVSIPASVDRPQFVVQAAPNRVALDEFNQWAAPLNESVARIVAENLVVLLGTPRVATASLANFDPAYQVTIDVQRFDSVKGEAATIEAVWVVRASKGGAVRSGRTAAREAVEGDSFEGLAAAHSRALAKLSGEIAAAIRIAVEEDAKDQAARNSPPTTRGKAKSSGSKK